MKHNFYIKKGYSSRLDPEYFFDIEQPGNVIWQPQVYKMADFLGKSLNCKYIIDIGCGTAKKLVGLYPNFQIIGVDYKSNLEICKEKYSFGTWIEHDLESDDLLRIPDDIVRDAVIVCADVIEHLINPGYLLMHLKELMNKSSICILSTPERDLTRGINDFGPPQNSSHVREWNREELTSLLTYFELNIKYSSLTISENVGKEKKTILKILGNNDLSNPRSLLLDSPQILNDINKLL
jgi:SAM-dependent methyltransferase